MKIDVYTSTGTKKGTLDLPEAIFGARINKGLIHLALVRQQGNRRLAVAHAKSRGEVVGSTKKLYQQKGTGNARRGPIRSPLMRGGGKAFGPKKSANFTRSMPKKMRRAALFSSLSMQAKNGKILGLENYPAETKTKTFVTLLKKLPVPFGRAIVVVTAGKHESLERSARNVPNVKTLPAGYLNPEDVLRAHSIIFLTDAVKVAQETFGQKERKEKNETKEIKEKKDAKPAKAKKAVSKSSRSSDSSK